MADTIATLGVRIDTSDAVKAASDLEKFAGKGAKAEQAAASLAAAGKAISSGFSSSSATIKQASTAVDDFIRAQNLQIATQGRSAAQAKLIELSVKGATAAQLEAVAANQKLIDGYEKGVAVGKSFVTGLKAIGIAAVAAGAAIGVIFQKTLDGASQYKDLGEQIGDTAANVSSLKLAADVSGKSLESVADFSLKLTKNLSKVDDESKLAGKALEAIGLNLKDFKAKGPVDQIEALAVALKGFADGPEKAAVLEALAKGSAKLIPFMNDLADGAERSIRLTDEQNDRIDEYTKKQARLRSEISGFAEVVVAESLPAIVALTGGFGDAIKGVLGLDEASNKLGGNKAIGEFAGNSAVFLAHVADAAFVVVQAFRYVGDAIGAAAAQVAALARLDLNAFKEIGKANNEFNDKFKFSLGLAEKVEARLNAPKKTADAAGGSANKPRIDTNGLVNRPKGKKDGSGDQEAKAQLSFDIDREQKYGEALSDTLKNNERILEASRQANLITEAEYYAKKRQFLDDNERVEEQVLQKKIARYQQERTALSNKADAKPADKVELIRIDQKIFDAEFQINRLREKNATDQDILDKQRVASIKKVQEAYDDAKQAADQYVRTVSNQNQRDLNGIGKGDLQREQDSRRNQRDDQSQQRLDTLGAEYRKKQITKEEYDKAVALEVDTHNRVLADDDRFFAERLVKQGDWQNGATAALQNYVDDTRNVMKGVQEIFSNAFKGLEDQLTNLFTGKKLDIKGLFSSISDDLIRQAVKTKITGPLASAMQDGIKSGEGFGSGIGKLFSSVFPKDGGSDGGIFGKLFGKAVSGSSKALSANGDETFPAAANDSGVSSVLSSVLGGNAAGGSALLGAAAALSGAAAALTAAAATLGGSSLASSGSSLFTGNSGGGGFGTGAAFGNMDFGGFFANGGGLKQGQWGIAGEKGAELVVGPSTVIPQGMLRGAANDGNGGAQVNNISINVPGNTSRDTSAQIASRTANEVNRVKRRGT